MDLVYPLPARNRDLGLSSRLIPSSRDRVGKGRIWSWGQKVWKGCQLRRRKIQNTILNHSELSEHTYIAKEILAGLVCGSAKRNGS